MNLGLILTNGIEEKPVLSSQKTRLPIRFLANNHPFAGQPDLDSSIRFGQFTTIRRLFGGSAIIGPATDVLHGGSAPDHLVIAQEPKPKRRLALLTRSSL